VVWWELERRDALDVRNRFTFGCAEWDVSSDEE
jgi:hypothetical protein